MFTGGPLRYSQGDLKEINDVSFEGMSYENLVVILKRLIPNKYFYRLYYCKTGTPLKSGIKELKTDNDVSEMLKAGYLNGNKMDLYLEHIDYDVLELLDMEDKEQNVEDSDDSYSSDDCEEVDYVDFQNEADDVVIKDFSSKDPFLNKLTSDQGLFRTYVHRQAPVSVHEPEEDPEHNTIDPAYKVKKGVVYPTFNPDIPWNQMKPILGMRYEDSQQLKFALANYGVANGYQLWYMKNDWRSVLAYCGRNVDEGRCAAKKGDKNRLMANQKKALVNKGEIVVRNDCGEGTSKRKMQKVKNKPVKKKKISALKSGNCCPFRLYATWMSNEHSFQIKSLIPDHKCSRNYNLGALVNYKWIAGQYSKEIIADPDIPYRKMKDDIRVKFKIDVSLGQCKRAKQRALYEHEGGLIEHYSKLYEYRNVVLQTNPGSTCRLDVDTSSNGNVLFKRMYICFKGVKDGWLAGCRKVIGLDGCFLKHTCRGELLTAMGRDANNQMYPIAWAVVRVENAENWGWFISLLINDLCLNDGQGITLISDSHKVTSFCINFSMSILY